MPVFDWLVLKGVIINTRAWVMLLSVSNMRFSKSQTIILSFLFASIYFNDSECSMRREDETVGPSRNRGQSSTVIGAGATSVVERGTIRSLAGGRQGFSEGTSDELVLRDGNASVPSDDRLGIDEEILAIAMNSHCSDLDAMLAASERMYELVGERVEDFSFRPVSKILLDGIESQEEVERVKAEIAENALKTYPIMGGRDTVSLFERFIIAQKTSENEGIRRLYVGMTPRRLIQRLLTKRPLAFYGSNDITLFRNLTQKTGGIHGIELSRDPHINIENYLTYDEIQLASLISMAVPTHFTNPAIRDYRISTGKIPSIPFEQWGILVGTVGARFERPGLMESQFIEVGTFSTPENGFGPARDPVTNQPTPGYTDNPKFSVWLPFYRKNERSGYFPTLAEVQELDRRNDDTFKKNYCKLSANRFIHKPSLSTRLYASLMPTFVDACYRSREIGKPAHIRITGLGTGVWNPVQGSNMIGNMIANVCADILEWVVTGGRVGVLEFCSVLQGQTDTFDKEISSRLRYLAEFRGIEIRVTHYRQEDGGISNSPVKDGCFLVAQYAWDGNSYPGNEYWTGSVTGSMDPVHAHVSMICELQNPLTNPSAFETDRIRVYDSQLNQLDTP